MHIFVMDCTVALMFRLATIDTGPTPYSSVQFAGLGLLYILLHIKTGKTMGQQDCLMGQQRLMKTCLY